MAFTLSESTLFKTAEEAAAFIGNFLWAEYSIIGEDLEGTLILWNEGARRLYGYEPAEVVGKVNASILYIPADIEAGKPDEIVQGALTTGKWEGVVERQRKDGSTFVARVVVTPRRNSAGTAVGLLLITKDISDELRLSHRLSHIEETQFYTRSLFESNIDALMATDPLGAITDVNREMELLTGLARGELIGTPFKNYFTDSERAEEGIRLVLREGRVTNYELTAMTPDGRETVVSYNASTFQNRDGKLQGVFAAARDITSQKELEGQLRNAQVYSRTIFDSNVAALMTTDPLGVITDVNPNMELLTLRSRDELIGTPFRNYVTDAARADEGIKLTLTEGKVANYELAVRAKDGSERVVSYNAAAFFDPNEHLQGVVAAVRDITELKAVEEALHQTNVELERANLSKDRFLASMSHELRTPLNAIIGYTGTLLMGLAGPLSEEQTKQVASVQRSGRHLLSLINDLLDLAKIESGKVELSLEPVVCQDVVTEVVESLRPLAEGKGLLLEAVLPDQPVRIETDRRLLSQILLNLMGNGIKFTEEGSVRVELTCGSNGGREIRFAVADTGNGIQDEDHGKLFNAFEQVGTSATRRHDGAGLGLHISQRLATLIGGRIDFESEYGKGSTFWLDLPGGPS